MLEKSTKKNKAIVCRFLDEAYNKKNLTVGDEVLAANVIIHVSNTELKGRASWKQYAGSFFAGFSGIAITVKDTIAEGDRVVANWICHGIHTGELQGIAPTGKKAAWTGIAIYRFVDGKIQEVWVWNDMWGMMRQLGVIPSG